MRSSRGSLPALLAHLVGVGVHAHRRLHALLRRVRRVEAERDLGPVEDLLAVVLGHADEVGDHVQRQPEREVPDEVAAGAAGEVVDEALAPGPRPGRSGRRRGVGVKPRLTSLRSWVWRGASRLISSSLVPPSPSPSAKLPSSRNGLGLFLKLRVAGGALDVGVAGDVPVADAPSAGGRGAPRARRPAARGTPRTGSRGRTSAGRAGRACRGACVGLSGSRQRVRRTGSSLSALLRFERVRRGSPVSSIDGNVVSSSSKNTLPSSRARWTPRQ